MECTAREPLADDGCCSRRLNRSPTADHESAGCQQPTWYMLLLTLRVLLPRINLPPKHTATSFSAGGCGGCSKQQQHLYE
jgi:hypothetical protein